MRRGEIRWYLFAPPDKRRPVLLLTRDQVIEQALLTACGFERATPLPEG